MTKEILTRFIESYCDADPLVLSSDLDEAIESGSYVAMFDDLGLTTILVFKVLGQKAYVNYAVIRPDMRGLGGVGLLTSLAHDKFPNLQYVAYHRLFKYPNRPVRFTHINRFKRIIRQGEPCGIQK
jgi:hypothetical protein